MDIISLIMEKLTVPNLKLIAKEHKIRGYSTMKKNELIKTLSNLKKINLDILNITKQTVEKKAKKNKKFTIDEFVKKFFPEADGLYPTLHKFEPGLSNVNYHKTYVYKTKCNINFNISIDLEVYMKVYINSIEKMLYYFENKKTDFYNGSELIHKLDLMEINIKTHNYSIIKDRFEFYKKGQERIYINLTKLIDYLEAKHKVNFTNKEDTYEFSPVN